MSHLIDMRNKRFGRLVVVNRAENSKAGQARWFCVCDCGGTNTVKGQDLRNGKVRSCGCYKIEQQTKHNSYKEPLYRVWTSMKNRCNCPTNKWYRIYGGKGVCVFSEWENDFMKFKEWAIKNGYKKGLTIDRIDVNGNYEPNNCRWITIKEQQFNKSTSVFVEIDGVVKTITEWCMEFDVKPSTAFARRKRGLNGIELFVNQDA